MLEKDKNFSAMKQLDAINSTIPSDILFAYSVGDLDPGMRLLVGCHASFNPKEAREIAFIESIGGAFLEQIAPRAMSGRALETILSLLDDLPPSVPSIMPESIEQSEIDQIPEPAKSIALRYLTLDGWKFLAPGVQCMELNSDPQLSGTTFEVRLMRLEPGRGAPKHTHGGSEFTLVLTGAFRDETGLHRPGDLSVATPVLTHRPIAEPGEVCIALTVTDAPLELTGSLGRLQRLLRHYTIFN